MPVIVGPSRQRYPCKGSRVRTSLSKLSGKQSDELPIKQAGSVSAFDVPEGSGLRVLRFP